MILFGEEGRTEPFTYQEVSAKMSQTAISLAQGLAVDGEGNDSRHETSPDSADKVRYVADEPNEEEGKRDALGRTLLVVLDQLRYLQKC